MKISIDWLKDFIDFDYSPEELAAVLTDLGLEASVEAQSYEFQGVVVGKIIKINAIPDSTHLTLCQVDVGSKQIPIVCGAPNVAVNALVPVAQVGATLPGGMKIKGTKIRGQKSQGMICAEDELGLSDDHSGIIILGTQAKIGQDFKDYLISTRDTIDLDLTPNRGDAFSHLGVARDLAAKRGAAVRMPDVSFAVSETPINELARIDITAPDGCHRYACRVITDVKIGSSPDWLVRRLEAVGLRSINNVVDASNYVLMELGHPLHVFDYDRLAENRIDVYFAQPGQAFTTLDGQRHTLDERHLLIADGQGPVALAGIMGGLESEVTEDSVNLLIESAYFAPSVIRRGSKSLDLSTEASKRFERDTDIDGLMFALDRVTSLIVKLAGGTVAKGRIDVYPTVHQPREIELSLAFTNRLLGTSLSSNEAADLLGRLKIQAKLRGKDILHCTVPLSRPELTQPVDLIEELARLAGYDAIPSVEAIDVPFQGLFTDDQAFHPQIRSILAAWGFNEHMANTLTRRAFIGLFDNSEAIELQNPLSSELAFLRTSLLPGLIQAVAFNERRQQRSVSLFEIGAVHSHDNSAYNRTRETFRLGLITTIGADSSSLHWKKPPPHDIYFLKGTVARLLQSIGVPNVSFKPAKIAGLNSALEVSSVGEYIGSLGELNADVRDILNLESRAVAAELDLGKTEKYRSAVTIYRGSAAYPVVERDIAIEVPVDIPVAELIKTIQKNGGKYFRDATIFDLYSGPGIEKGKQSLAFRLYFQSDEGTLIDNDVDKQVQQIVEELTIRHQARWRQS